MKILITVDTYFPDKNGVQYVTQYQAEGLAKAGNEVTVITSNVKGNYKNKEIHNDVKILRVNAYNKNMFHYGNKSEFQNLVMKLSNDCDVMMNVCLQSFAADWVLPLLKKVKCKKILMMHSMHEFGWKKEDFGSVNLLVKKVLRNFRWGVFYNTYWKYIFLYNRVIHLHEKDYSVSYFQKRHYYNNSILYNAVDNDFFELENKEDIIINVASFNSRKNQLLALTTFYQSKTEEYKLVLIGMPNGEYYQMLKRKINEFDMKYGKKNVEIYVNLDREKTKEFIKKSKIFLMTSTWEGFPISIIEAMASGATFISTNVGIVKYLPGGQIVTNNKQLIDSLEQMIAGEWKKNGEIAYHFAYNNMRQERQVEKLEQIMRKER